MRFRPRAFREEPEINFIPLIDVLLVILIFLMVTTTYSRYAELKINLPTADAAKAPERVDQIDVAVDAKGAYSVNKNVVPSATRVARWPEVGPLRQAERSEVWRRGWDSQPRGQRRKWHNGNSYQHMREFAQTSRTA